MCLQRNHLYIPLSEESYEGQRKILERPRIKPGQLHARIRRNIRVDTRPRAPSQNDPYRLELRPREGKQREREGGKYEETFC